MIWLIPITLAIVVGTPRLFAIVTSMAFPLSAQFTVTESTAPTLVARALSVLMRFASAWAMPCAPMAFNVAALHAWPRG